MTPFELILLSVTATLAVFCGLLVKGYLPAYVTAKAKNLATKEDVAEITNRVERVRAAISNESVLLKKRREVYERIANSLRIFIAGHAASDTEKEEFHSAYSACWLWAPDELLTSLNKFIRMQQEVAVNRAAHYQDAMKQVFGEIMLRMRKDAGFPTTEIDERGFTFVQF